jgi:hypothetical protein
MAILWGIFSLFLLTFYIDFPTTLPFPKPVTAKLPQTTFPPRQNLASADIPYTLSDPRKYLLLIPAFGPNNQYRGMKEALIAARFMNRVFVLPDFVKHHTPGMEGLRKYDTTFIKEPFSQFVEVVTMEEFAKIRNSTIDLVVWVRKADGYWKNELANYLNITSLRAKDEKECKYLSWNSHSTDPNSKVYFSERDHFSKYFKEIGLDHNLPAVALCFPFRSIEGSMSDLVTEVSGLFERAPSIKELATKAWEDMSTTHDKVLAVHWRHGEQTCRIENPTLHKGFDFCFGTSAYIWAKLSDIIEVLKNELKNHNLTHIYLATDSDDTVLYERMKKELPISRATDIPALSSLSDNYILSLVEQEICSRAKFFVASAQTTWSEFIINYWDSKKLHDGAEPPMIETLDGLLTRNGKRIVQHDYWSWILKAPPIPPEHCLQYNVDFPGNDLNSHHSYTDIDCYGICLSENNCACWTFSERYRRCYTKGPTCPPAKNVSVSDTLTSGPKDCPFHRTGPNDCFFKDADQMGYDVGSEENKDSTDCPTLCQKNPQCSCWTWVPETRICWLKSQCPRYNYNIGKISGPSHCPQPTTPKPP